MRDGAEGVAVEEGFAFLNIPELQAACGAGGEQLPSGRSERPDGGYFKLSRNFSNSSSSSVPYFATKSSYSFAVEKNFSR